MLGSILWDLEPTTLEATSNNSTLVFVTIIAGAMVLAFAASFVALAYAAKLISGVRLPWEGWRR